MAKAKVAINGFGRIGRNFFRAHLQREGDFEVIAANDLGDLKTMAHLLKHDSVLGRLDEDIEVGDGTITVGGDEIRMFSEKEPNNLPWRDLDVDIVLESTGFFTDRDGAGQHLDAGASKVVISAPATDPDVTVVLGVNDDHYDPESHRIVSNASCTTNCVAPMAKVLHDALTIERGFMTTIHAYTADERLQGLLAYSDEPLASQDIVGSPYSCTFDSELTMVNGRLVKVFGWYDNEWGYSCRLVDLVSKMAGAALPKAEAAATA